MKFKKIGCCLLPQNYIEELELEIGAKERTLLKEVALEFQYIASDVDGFVFLSKHEPDIVGGKLYMPDDNSEYFELDKLDDVFDSCFRYLLKGENRYMKINDLLGVV